MKNLFLTLISLFFSVIVFSQTEPDTTITDFTKGDRDKLKKEDYIVIETFTDLWQNTPAILKTKTINRGFNTYFMLDNPLGKSNISIAYGIGVSAHNMYSNCVPDLDSTGKSYFLPIDDFNYSKNKLTLFYTDIPVEIRFRTKKNTDNFKFSIGFKAGYLIQSHTKYKGDRLNNVVGTKYKVFDIPNIETFRYGITARIGYGKVNLFGYYSLTNLFKKGKGPELFPVSVGVVVTPI